MYSPASLKAEALGRRWLNKIIAQTPACWITVCREEGFVRQPHYTTVQWLIRPRSTSWGSWKADKIFLLADLPWLNVDKLYFYSLNFLTFVYNIKNVTSVCWVHVFDHFWYFSRLNIYKQAFYVLHERLSYRVAGVTVYSRSSVTTHAPLWEHRLKHRQVSMCQNEIEQRSSIQLLMFPDNVRKRQQRERVPEWEADGQSERKKESHV